MKTIQIGSRAKRFERWVIHSILGFFIPIVGAFGVTWAFLVCLGIPLHADGNGKLSVAAVLCLSMIVGEVMFWFAALIFRGNGEPVDLLPDAKFNVVYTKIERGTEPLTVQRGNSKQQFCYRDDVGIPPDCAKFIFLREEGDYRYIHAQQKVLPIVLSETNPAEYPQKTEGKVASAT